MANSLFAALSIVSSLGKKAEEDMSLKSVEVTSSNVYMIQGTYENVNNIHGLLSSDENGYFYTFNLSNDFKVIKNDKYINIEDIKIGDKLTISYDGEINLTYPPQLNNVYLIKVEKD